MFKYENLYPLLIPIISSIIIFSWFYEGKIISNNSEENLNIFHSQKSAEHLSTFWNPTGIGWKSTFSMPGYPTFALLGFLESRNVPAFLIQAMFLGTIMTVGILSMYILIRNGLRMNYPVAFLGSFFYLLNIYSLTQIWKRFIYSHMIAWAYLPLFIFIWIKWIGTGKLTWLFYFLLSSLIFAHTFSNPVFLSTFWVPASIFVLNELWFERRNKKNIVKILISLAVGLILWIVVNIWWLYPTLTLGSSWSTQTGQTWEGDLSSLKAVSGSFPIWEVLSLRQSWYLGPDNDWFSFYHNPLVIIISIIVFLITFAGALRIRSQRLGKYLIYVSLIGLFISKGTNVPFGYSFFHFLFSTFPLTTALRNSYEKFGIVFLLPYAIFFALGLRLLLSKLKSSHRYFIGGLVIFLSYGLLVYPMWNGDIFPQKHRVIVPTYYIEANDYLSRQSSLDFPNRVFHIPFLLEIEKLQYSWGYMGEDPSENLFDLEPASKLGAPLYSLFYKTMIKYLDNKEFPRILGLLGIENVILHKDNIYPKIDSDKTKDIIENWNGVKEKEEFGLLTIYSLAQELIRPRIFTANSFIQVQSVEEGILKTLNGAIEYKNTVFTSDPSIFQKAQGMSSPGISFNRKSNSSYLVDIKNAKAPFILVLNNTFDKSWQARIGKEIIGNHIVVNGYANGWIIRKIGDYKVNIDLKVWPWD